MRDKVGATMKEMKLKKGLTKICDNCGQEMDRYDEYSEKRVPIKTEYHCGDCGDFTKVIIVTMKGKICG